MEKIPIPESLAGVAGYYSSLVTKHGATPRGVDWNGAESQNLRFLQLARIVDRDEPFSLQDLGCGYGAFYDFLSSRFRNVFYRGCDISPEMIDAMRARLGRAAGVSFSLAAQPPAVTDYCVASGIFNVRLQTSDADWRDHIESTLAAMNRASQRGFAFNCLTSYSDAEKKKDYLYYADPGFFFDLCKRKFSRNVALLHDYGLFEFTILVRK